MRTLIAGCAAILSATACIQPPAEKIALTTPADTAAYNALARKAPENYTRLINANNLDSLSSILTDDVVFMVANDKPIVGKAAVREWGDGYLKAFKTHWDKPIQEFIITGDYAFERYSYTSSDTPVGGGKDVVDTGWGFVVFHHDADGVWRVARDAFGPDHAPGK
jgi:ketosteroid isomerase-like protein